MYTNLINDIQTYSGVNPFSFVVNFPRMEKGKKYGRYDDAILVRMEKTLRKEIERLSVEEDIPVSTMARKLIREGLTAREGKKEAQARKKGR